MTITKEKTKDIISSYGKNGEDSGSSEAQIAIFTERIRNLTDHLKANKKDRSAQRGLMLLVAQRAKLLKYLKRTKLEDYKQIINKLELRK